MQHVRAPRGADLRPLLGRGPPCPDARTARQWQTWKGDAPLHRSTGRCIGTVWPCPGRAIGIHRGCARLKRMLWIKSLHIFFVVGWFAGLFYLPRIFVNLAMVPEVSHAERGRLLLMAGKLLRFMTAIAVPALAFGLILWLHYGIGMGPGQGWLHAKLLLVLLLVAYHGQCWRILMRLRRGTSTHGHVWFRWFNELPTVVLLAVTLLVVVKPF